MYFGKQWLWMVTVVVTGATIAGGCTTEDMVFQSNQASPRSVLFATGAGNVSEVVGDIGPRAKYGIFVPADWNGSLALYAHGFKDPEDTIELPVADYIVPLRDKLLSLGYAVAYSSYSENGLSVRDGAQRTHQLRAIFVSAFGEPERTYLLGHSLGGLVAVMLAEKYPERYDGALPMCGMIGGSKAEIDYIGHLRTLFDVFYPGVLPGNTMDVPDNADLTTTVVYPVIAAIQADPTGVGIISVIEQTPIPFTRPEELVESFVRGIGFQFRGFQDVVARTHGHIPFDNADTEYTGPSLPAEVLVAVNAGAERFEATPDALKYLEHFYRPTGSLGIPVLTLHNRWDPVVPAFHEDLYRETVATAGKEALLAQRTVDIYGHCMFGETPEEGVEVMAQAFLDLAEWVCQGTVPE